jgi:hypothetical protein
MSRLFVTIALTLLATVSGGAASCNTFHSQVYTGDVDSFLTEDVNELPEVEKCDEGGSEYVCAQMHYKSTAVFGDATVTATATAASCLPSTMTCDAIKTVIEQELKVAFNINGANPFLGIINGAVCSNVVLAKNTCNAGPPDFDQEGMVCSDDTETPSYCSYLYDTETAGPHLACAYCASVGPEQDVSDFTCSTVRIL